MTSTKTRSSLDPGAGGKCISMDPSAYVASEQLQACGRLDCLELIVEAFRRAGAPIISQRFPTMSTPHDISRGGSRGISSNVGHVKA